MLAEWAVLAFLMQAGAAHETGAVSGVVRDTDTHQPMAGAMIFLGSPRRGKELGVTGEDGAYHIANAPAGTLEISVLTEGGFGAHDERTVTVAAGQDIQGIDFSLRRNGTISGRVVDENKEPVMGASVAAGGRFYSLGALHFAILDRARTDEHGEFVMKKVPAGRPVFVFVRDVIPLLDTMSKAPADPKLRKKAHEPVYYPGVPDEQGAQMITLRSGGRMDAVDFVMRSSASYCLEGEVRGSGVGGRMEMVMVELPEAVMDPEDGGSGVGISAGKTGPKGLFRVCGLHPGDYRISALEPPQNPQDPPLSFGTATVSIFDKDVRKFELVTTPPVPLKGGISISGEAPDSTAGAKMHVALMPVGRPSWMGEFKGLDVEAAVPGEFTLPGVLMDKYDVWMSGVPEGVYVKDVTYGNESILHGALEVGKAQGGDGVRVTLALDGGTIQAKVADRDGKAMADCSVLVIPGKSMTPEALAAELVIGKTDQNGSYSSKLLVPGEYFLVATEERIYRRPVSIAKVWAARRKGQEVDLAAKGTASVNLEPAGLQ